MNDRPARFTRRKLAVAALAATGGMAQTGTPPAPQTPEQQLQAARDQLRRSAEAMRRVPLPQSVEPAFHFKP